MKKIHPLFLATLSGLLLFAAWPVSPFTFLIFIAFVPLLWLEHQGITRKRFLGYAYLTLLIWNAATTWWTCNSTLPGGIAAILANSVLMSIPLLGFYNVKKRLGEKAGYLSFIIFWLTFEYIHLNWELSWPWLTLGNVFATHTEWIQWYAFTGTSVGSLWVLLVNLLCFLLLRQKIEHSSFNTQYSIFIVLLLVIPVALSLLQYSSHTDIAPQQQSANIVIVQPNIDPWNEKFIAGSEEGQLLKLIRLSEAETDSNTTLVIWPETAIPVPIEEDSIKTVPFLSPVRQFLKRHPSVNLLTGIEGFRVYDVQHKTPFAQKIQGTDKYLDSYNSAVLMDSSSVQIYHKSKFVPGAENLPSFLHFLDRWFEKFGGTTSGYSGQADRTVLKTTNHSYAIAPSVCYESVFGEFMAQYIPKGASLIALITNDGWWGNTAGYKQHESYARLRAIETRRWIARSANTGISCFISPYGQVLQPQPWDKATAIKMAVPVNDKEISFFAKHGDILSKIVLAVAILLIILDLGSLFRKQGKHV